MFLHKNELWSRFQIDQTNGAKTYYDKGDTEEESKQIQEQWTKLVSKMEAMVKVMYDW